MIIPPNEIKEWMEASNYTQQEVATMLGTTSGTISRWIAGKVEIPLPQKKLLAYLIRGEMPFPVQNAKDGMYLDFSADEFALIQLLARREGFACAEDWIASKIRAYLAMQKAGPPMESLRVAEDETPYIVTKKY